MWVGEYGEGSVRECGANGGIWRGNVSERM